MFELHNTTAVYRGEGEIDAAEIALSVLAAKQAAAKQDITDFVAVIPNSSWDAVAHITRLVCTKPLIEQRGEKGITIRYKFDRQVVVTMTGAPTLLQTPSETLDLAHRVVTAPTANGIESI